MIREVSRTAFECPAPPKIETADDAVEQKKDSDKPGRPGGPMFDLNIVNQKSMQVPVVVRQIPGGQVAERHDKGDGDHQRDEQSAKPVAEEETGAFSGQGRKDEDAADQEHQ